jgi:nicotinamidase-related amidase
MLKETYLHGGELDSDISKIIADLKQSGARSAKWEGEMRNAALILTDLQNYFFHSESHAFIPSAPVILDNIRRLICLFRECGRPVIFTKHTNTQENAAGMSHWWKDMIVPGSAWSDLVDDLFSSGDIIIEKHQYDAFYNTDLDGILLVNEVTSPVICGVMTNLCCETTVRTAFVKGFRPVLPLDATAAYNREFHIATFRNLSFGFCPLLTTAEVIQKLLP